MWYELYNIVLNNIVPIVFFYVLKYITKASVYYISNNETVANYNQEADLENMG